MPTTSTATNGGTSLVVSAELADRLKTELNRQQVLQIPTGSLTSLNSAGEWKVCKLKVSNCWRLIVAFQFLCCFISFIYFSDGKWKGRIYVTITSLQLFFFLPLCLYVQIWVLNPLLHNLMKKKAFENIEKGENTVNPLPHMPTLGSSNSAANKDMMSKILTNGHTIF